VAEFQAQGLPVIQLDDSTRLGDALKPHAPKGAEVVFDTTGFLLPAAVDALATFGRIVVIAAPMDQGHVRVPLLNLYRRGGSIVGVNTLLYDVGDCAAMLSAIAPGFDSGELHAPVDLRIWPIDDGVAAYEATHRGSVPKAVLSFD
jgi:NADPH:quinone reductase-like Zn-dependent oxidoreductase